MQLQLTVVTPDDNVFPVIIDDQESVENVKAILEVETTISIPDQTLAFQGRELDDRTTLKANGVSDGDLLMLSRRPRAPQATISRPTAAPDALALNPDGSAVNPQAYMDLVAADVHGLAQLQARVPALADAIRARDVQQFQSVLREVRARQRDAERAEWELVNGDPFDPEVQRRIAEKIAQEQVNESFENAMEHMPEMFGDVVMLYVAMEVNGVPLPAFVDSGAQMTIMSRSCAERCNLLRLVDQRFQGTAKGVGSSKILGRIHQAPLKVCGYHLPLSICVLESEGMDFLFGLDMLRRHQCCIDLAANKLLFQGINVSLPFLPEHEIPKRARSDDLAQLAGPSGTPSQAPQAAMSPAGERPAAPSAVPTAQAPAGNSEVEGKIMRLMALGFTREQVASVLEICGNNEDMAASMLFGM